MNSNEIEIQELEAKIKRLKAESKAIPFEIGDNSNRFIKNEYSLYTTHQKEPKDKNRDSKRAKESKYRVPKRDKTEDKRPLPFC